MKVGLYLTCHGMFIEELVKALDLKWTICFAPNFLYFNSGRPLPPEWRKADIFIYQPIENPPAEIYKDEYVLSDLVNPSAVVLRVPYLMWTGLYPWHYEKAWPGLGTAYGNKWIDDNLEDLASGKLTAKDVEEIVVSNELLRNSEGSLNTFRAKEQRSDISGLADFVERNYADRQLFWTPNHPRGLLALEFCRAIWRSLALNDIPQRMEGLLDQVLSIEKCPVLPSVVGALRLRHDPNPCFFNDRVSMTSSEYIREYVRRRIRLNSSNDQGN